MLLQLEELKMYYRSEKLFLRAVDGISFDLDKGRTLGIVGESGCGKSSVALSILRSLPENGKIVGGRILFDDENILSMPLEEFRRKIRWKRISMIFQGAMNVLDPVYKVGDQLIDVLRLHENISKSEARKKVESSFELVRLSPSRMNNYPHEFSGGMKQRAIIAMSLLCNPDLVIADEPTTALDVLVKDQIIGEMEDLQRRLGISMIYISHDMSAVYETCEKIAVIYAGKIIETAETRDLFRKAAHPYTIGLLRAIPNIHGPLRNIISLPGDPPNLLNPPQGCRFEPRCPRAESICRDKDPPQIRLSKDHYSLCHFAEDPTLHDIKFEKLTSRGNNLSES